MSHVRFRATRASMLAFPGLSAFSANAQSDDGAIPDLPEGFHAIKALGASGETK
jgi:hypothetical protein